MNNIKKIGLTTGGILIGASLSKILNLCVNFIMTKQHLNLNLQIAVFLIVSLIIAVVGICILSRIDNECIEASSVYFDYKKILRKKTTTK